MKEQILSTLKATVDAYPEVAHLLRGSAKWIAEVYACKLGEAPDDDERRKQERKLKRDIITFFEEQKKRIIKMLKRRYNDKDIQLSFWDDELMRMWNELGGDFVGILVSAVGGGIEKLPDELSQIFSEIDMRSAMIAYAPKYRGKWIKSINQTTWDYVDELISDWQQSGQPFPTLLKTLTEDKSLMFDKVRAEMIATTEVTRIHAQGNALAWEATGYIKEFRWNTANDERVCAICGPRENKIFPLSFIEDNMPAHPRCRCWSTPIVDETLIEYDFTLEPGETL